MLSVESQTQLVAMQLCWSIASAIRPATSPRGHQTMTLHFSTRPTEARLQEWCLRAHLLRAPLYRHPSVWKAYLENQNFWCRGRFPVPALREYPEMSLDLISVLKKYQDEPKLGSISRQVLQFVEGTQCKFLQSPGPGQSSRSVVRMYEIRKGLNGFHSNAFVGLQESIESLNQRDVTVHLSVIETEKGVVSVWLVDEASPPLAIVLAKFQT